MSITLELDEQALASLPLKPGERERHMQIELACRFYAKGWLSFAQAARLAALDQYAFGVALAERGIPRQYGLTEAVEDLTHARAVWNGFLFFAARVFPWPPDNVRVVSNTSPVANLAVIGRLELLRLRYGTVSIPPRVSQELARLSHAAGKATIAAALAEGWLVVEASPNATCQLPFRLDPGEEEAIMLALELRADVLLMDEKRGREAARKAGLKVAGVLGELLHAKLVGRLPALRPEILRLRDEAGFFVDASIEQFLLSQAGEG